MNEVSIFASRRTRGLAQAAVSGISAGLPPHVSIKGNRFALVDAGGTRYPWPQMTLPVVIIDANPQVSKLYYANPYDPNADDMPPDCFADNGVAPSRNAASPQARTCAECQWNAWGSSVSKMTGKGVKACSDRKKIAVLVVGDTAGIPYQLQVPPATLKNLKNYSDMVGSHPAPGTQRQLDLSDVLTTISFVDGVNGIMDFKATGYITPELGAAIDIVWDSGVTDKLVGKDDMPRTGELPAPQAAPQLQAPRPLPAQPAAQPVAPFPTQQQAALPAQPAEEPKRGGRRPGAGRPPGVPNKPKEAPAAQLEGNQGEIPPFLRRQPAQAPEEFLAKSQVEKSDNKTGPQFGMERGEPVADPGLQAALDEAFSLDTKR